MHIPKAVRVFSVYTLAALFSLMLHGGVVALLLLQKAPEAPTRKIVPPTHIKARLVQKDPKVAARKQKALLDAAKKRAQQLRKKADAQEKRFKDEARKETLKKEVAKKAAAKKEQLKQAQLKKDAAKALKTKREKERKHKALQAEKVRKKQEKAKAVAREKALANRMREQALASALDSEEALLDAEHDAVMVADYATYIKERIVLNWNRPPSARRGMEAVLAIQLLPTGQVVSVVIEKSSGSDAFDLSVQQAVKKVDRFEKIRELYRSSPGVFDDNFRQLRLVFRPEDLRL